MKKLEISHIDELIRKADFYKTKESYDVAYKFLEELDKKYSDDYLLNYYKGLVCYSHIDVDDFRIKWAITHFENSLKLSPEFVMPKIYLGYSYFDLKKYVKSQETFYEILSEKKYYSILIENKQIWRIANIAELVALCDLKLKWFHKFTYSYFNWHNIFKMGISNDDLYFPESLIVEVAEFLKVNGNSLGKENSELFNVITPQLISIIRDSELEDIYTEELNILKNWDGQEQHLLLDAICR